MNFTLNGLETQRKITITQDKGAGLNISGRVPVETTGCSLQSMVEESTCSMFLIERLHKSKS